MPILQTFHLNFYGLPIVLRGSYIPADQSVGLGSSFEIYDVRAKAVRAGDIEEVELSLKEAAEEIIEWLVEEGTRACEDALDGAACEAYEQRMENRRLMED